MSGEEHGLNWTHEHCKRLGLVVSLVSLLAPSAYAQTPPPKKPAKPAKPVVAVVHPAPPANPKKLLISAQTKRTAGDFAGALADYQAADAVAPTPATLEGIAYCHDKLGHYDDALTWYDAFLANVPPAMQLLADQAKAHILVIKAMPGHLHVESTPSNVVAQVDGKDQPTHTPLDLVLAPGKHALHLTAPGYDPVDKDVEIASRAQQNLAVVLPVTPPPPPSARADRDCGSASAAEAKHRPGHRHGQPCGHRSRRRNGLRDRGTERQE